jgi:hypothetical protein
MRETYPSVAQNGAGLLLSHYIGIGAAAQIRLARKPRGLLKVVRFWNCGYMR